MARRGSWAGALGVLLALILVALPAHAQQQTITPKRVTYVPLEQVKPDWYDCGLRKDPNNVDTVVRWTGSAKSRKQGATIEVNYGSGFTPEARAAFERAVAIWERHIDSPIPIRIDATFADLGENVLGGAGPNFIYGVDTTGTGGNDLIIGDALLDAVTEQDQNPDGPDIVARFSSTRDDWHFGEDETPPDHLDFTGVVLHEIGHGLNYFDLLNFDSGTGSFGADFDGNGQISEDEKVPGIYEVFLAQRTSGESRFLVDSDEFSNPSSELGAALTSNNIVFDGESANRAAELSTGPVPPKIYAPRSWEGGSSISHLDEFTYPPGDPNALMSPFFNAGETARLPGPVMCGQLQDIAWPLASECKKFFSDVFSLAANASSAEGTVSLSWEVSDDVEIEEYFVERQAFDGDFTAVKTLPGSASPQVTLTNQGLGTFTYRLRWRTASGSEDTTVEQPTVTLNVQDVQATVGNVGPRGRGDLNVTWGVPPGTEGFTYTVQTTPHGTDDFQGGTTTNRMEARVERRPPGRYRVRVVAKKDGNSLASEAASVEISFDGAVAVLGPFPNPTASTATVNLTARGQQQVAIQVYDRLGRRLFQEERVVLDRAPERIQIDTSSWASGLYFLRVVGTDFAETRELAVVR